MMVPHEATGGVTGGPRLKETQEYTDAYAREVLAIWKAADYAKLSKPQFTGATTVQTTDLWEDTGMDDLCSTFGLPFDRLIVPVLQ